MKYTHDFESRVLSVIRDYKIKDDIINGKMDLGDYLKEYAFKGIDSRTILECLRLNDLEHLEKLARHQEIIKALYQEWFEVYVMRNGSTIDDYYQEQTELCSIIDDIIEQPDVFYRMVGEQLTPEERQYIKSLLPKSCDTCSNGCCRVEQADKPIYDCIAWENNSIVGQYKVLKLNKKSKR